MNLKEYCLGKDNNSIAMGLTSAVYISGFSCVVLIPFYIYLYGADVIWILIGCALSLGIMWGKESFRFMRYRRKHESLMTLPGYLDLRFGGGRRALRSLAAAEIIVMGLIISAMMLKEFTLILSKTTGISTYITTSIVVVLVGVLLCVHGLSTLGWISVISAPIIVVVMLVCTLLIFLTMSIAEMVRNMMFTGIEGSVTNYLNIIYHDGKLIGACDYISLLSVGMFIIGVPFQLSLFMGMDDGAAIARCRRSAIAFMVVIMSVSCFLGGASRGFMYPYEVTASLSDYINNLSLVIAYKLPCGKLLSVLYLTVVYITIIVMIAGNIHSIISTLSVDVIDKLYIVRRGKSHDVKIYVLATFVTIVLIYFMSLCFTYNSVNMIVVFMELLGMSLGPVILMSLLWKRMTAAAAVAGMVTGWLSVVMYEYITGNAAELGIDRLAFYEYAASIGSAVPAFMITIIVIVAVSCLTKCDSEICEEFEEVKHRIV